jgi:methylglutaconyl-CoA hydratase
MSAVVVSEMNHVAYVKLNRPEIRNAFSPDMINQLTTLFRSFEARKDLRAVVLFGEGKAFCAGADLQWMQSMIHYNLEQNKKDAENLFTLFETIEKCSLPVLGRVHGAAIGGALGLLSVCDEVIAEKSTQFCFSEVKLGIAPAVISRFVSPKCNPARLRPLMLSGRVFDVDEAVQLGLVQVVAEDGESHTVILKYLNDYMVGGPEAIRETKKLLTEILWLNAEGQKEKTTKVIAERRVSREGQEGLQSFLDKRNPSWRMDNV